MLTDRPLYAVVRTKCIRSPLLDFADLGSPNVIVNNRRVHGKTFPARDQTCGSIVFARKLWPTAAPYSPVLPLGIPAIMVETDPASTLGKRKSLLDDGYCLLPGAVLPSMISALTRSCERMFNDGSDDVRARSSRGYVYAARNLIDGVPEVRTFWQSGFLCEFLQEQLGDHFGLVRVLFFDKPPERSWALPWHKDTAIAVKDNSIPSDAFSRPTVKAGVPHVVAHDDLLRRMLTLRVHLDDVTNENGPLKVIPGSHTSSTSEGLGVERAVIVRAAAGDVLAMRPLITHASGASELGTRRHRRILHLEFAPDPILPDGFDWHDYVSIQSG